ncbi:1-acyl-sn-glycerol-3-phosphate acyltransferase [Candidatus Obscuribacterales bacterium]|nr:1-acyl-sn-glycerol-3-phosphate acyltransferase [Candidatus Obscuribacterales bacterium]
MRINPFWKCRFEGLENLTNGNNYVIVANHQSLVDIFILSGLRHHFRWVVKDSLMRVPIFGLIMKINGDVSIKRGDLKSVKEMMSDCKGWLNKNVSILIFPEGTRSEDGKICQFRDGPFRLSVDCDVPVLPVVIAGTRQVLAKHARVLNFAAEMTVRILPPVMPASFQESPVNMRRSVQAVMIEQLAQMTGDGGSGETMASRGRNSL